MIQDQLYFKGVTLLVTHYNRSNSLERLLNSFVDLRCVFEEVIISDDGSKTDHIARLNQLKHKFNFKLLTSSTNKGLGHNINKGQDIVATPFTLYIQEDFIANQSFPFHFHNALRIMKEDQTVDLISLYAYSPYPYSKSYKEGFSEKIFHFAPWYTNNLKFYLYGDHPHLRRSSFASKFGRYIEGMNGDLTEMNMSLAFIAGKGKCLLYDDHYGLLTQENSEIEPSTATFRKAHKFNDNGLYVVAKWMYGKYKFLKLNFWLVKKLIKRQSNRYQQV